MSTVQRLVVEVDSHELLKEYLRIAMTTVLTATEEIALKTIDRDMPNFSSGLPSVFYDQSKSFPVILVGGLYLPKDGKVNSYFNGYGPWETFQFGQTIPGRVDAAIARIMEIVKANDEAWAKRFLKERGDGYNEFFLPCDGTIETGYELRSCNCFSEVLAISIVHIHYGN